MISLLFVAAPLSVLFPAVTFEVRATEVSGDIYSTALWSSTMSPVHITGNVTVHDSASLSIQAGTEVRFDEGTHLNIEGGTLSVQGTMNSPVLFLPNSTGSYKGYYDWIYVNNSPSYKASVSVQWADLSYGVKGFYLDGVQGARFDHVSVNSSSEAGFYLNACSGAGLWNCSVSDSDAYGIWLDGSDNVTVGDCVLSVPAGTAVFLQGSTYDTVQTTTADGSLWGVRAFGSEHDVVSQCYLGSDVVGIELEGSPNNTVSGNTFSGDSTGLLLNGSRDNLLSGNDFTGCQLPLSFDGGPDAAANHFSPDNLVNGLPVRCVLEGDLDGVSAGAVVLAGVGGSTVSNITFPAAGGMLVAYLCGNVTFRDMTIPDPYYGIMAAGCLGVSLDNVTVSGAKGAGLLAAQTSSLAVSNSTFRGCTRALVLDGPLNATLNGDDVTQDPVGLELAGGTMARCVDCTFSNVSLDASSLLYEDYSLRIRVTDNASMPLPGVDARVENGGQTFYASAHFGGADPPSDAGGGFRPIQVTAAEYAGATRTPFGTLVEVWDGVNSFEGNPRNLTPAAPTDLVFSPSDTGVLSGMVRDESGQPVAGVNIVLDDGHNTSTGADGRYSFPPLVAGTVTLNASLAGWQTVHRPGIVISAGQTAYVNLTLAPEAGATGELRGIVSDQDGSPLEGAFVSIAGDGNATTAPSGLFHILSAPAGWVNITVSKAGYHDAVARAYVPPNGASSLANITLLPNGGAGNGTVAGQVWDAVNLTLMGGVSVWVEDIPSISNVTDSEGYFVLPQVPAGNHTILASISGFANGSTAVDVIAGKTNFVNFYMAGPTAGLGGLIGKVYDNVRKTYLGGATVRIDGTARMAGTDPVGDYRFENLRAGTYSVTAAAPSMGWTNMQDVVVNNGEWTTLDIWVGTDVKFANNTLGVSVSGDITGNGTLMIRKALPPKPLANGVGDCFEIKEISTNMEQLSLNFANINITYTNQSAENESGAANVSAGWNITPSECMFFWNSSGWTECDPSGVDLDNYTVWANVTHLTIFGIAVTGHAGPTGGSTVVALPTWLSPVAVVVIVLLVGVPIGIIVIRVRQPPSGGNKGQVPVPPQNQRGTNLYP